MQLFGNTANNGETYHDSTTEDTLLPGGMLYLKLDDPLIKTKKDIAIEEIESEIAKKLRMKGVILSDARLLKAMDSNMIKESSVLDLSIKKDGSYTSKVPVASKEQFDNLMKHMKKILKKIGDEILSGNIKNEPIKKKNQTPCEYCDYKLICRFDKDLGNQFRVINELKNEEVLKKISE
ncbi:MAG: PD-(D/E)XK nuclease family protein [Clostridia bacterium]|nr:PD-(D/E)XK nuclease family protein [Clostridia bacterium]